jgi:hypothetical protein
MNLSEEPTLHVAFGASIGEPLLDHVLIRFVAIAAVDSFKHLTIQCMLFWSDNY